MNRSPSPARRRRALVASAATLLLSPPLHAQDPAPSPPPSTDPAELAPVVITGNPLRSDRLAVPATTLSGDRLTVGRGGTLGETLDGTPGVASTFFGPNASRPIIRGQDGDRIRLLSNGGSALDASSLSFDHAVPIDPLTVERVEVLRGPAALLYGGSAVGGVVNSIDNRIPKRPAGRASGAIETRFGGAAGERGASAVVEAGGPGLALHADAFWRQTDDLAVPRYDRPTKDGGTERQRRVVNSASLARGGAFGGSLLWDHGHLGASVDTYRNTYGVVAEDDVTIRMKRDKFALAGEVRNLGGPLHTLRAQAAHTDYRHEEVDGGGAVGTTFKNRGADYRLEAVHAPWSLGGGRVDGVIGAQGETSRLSALGEEAFVPGTHTRHHALFLLEQWRPSPRWQWSGGLRVERVRVRSEGDASGVEAPRFGDAAERRWITRNASLGTTVQLTPAWQLQSHLASTERAPTSYELFANGVHAATGAYERGDVDQRTERGRHFDAALHWKDGDVRAKAGLFWSRFSNYIALMRDAALDTTDDAGGAIPGHAFRGVAARLWGWELEGSMPLATSPTWGRWTLEAQGDAVRGDNLSADEPLPRLAPMRATLALNWRPDDGWTSRLEVRHALKQNRVPGDDTATPAWTVVNLSLSRRVAARGGSALLFVKLHNLGNALAYNASTLGTVRALSPLPGRSLSAGVRVSF